ncbi:MAG TPA: MFS transporter [Streptomyces sp.]|uniref:MFS transporter n=1 Tax=Streptomyces sp. TaxID=1931 RepID=UPI002C942292|nr:MFS transporter [Streptomyces sp.]HWU10856.1 MFS transporter [Streptomyces sp.]
MSARVTDDAAVGTGRSPWLGLAVLALPTLLVALDMNVLFLALPQLTADLGAGAVQQLWITDVYGFMVAGLVITMGTLGDRIGRRRLLMIGVAGFLVASVIAAYATSPAMLIAARAVLGIAGATLMPSTLALISNMFRDDQQRGKAIAIWATCNFTGAALGPVVGGLLLDYFWWGSVFLMAVPVMVLVLIGAPMLLPEFRPEQTRRVDMGSVLLSLLGILPVVYAIKALAVGSGSMAIALVALVFGLVFLALFARRQLRIEDPMLDLRLFASSSFTLILTALVLAGVVMAGTGLLVTQLLQTVLGYSPFVSAWLFAPMGLAVAVGTMSTPALTRTVKPQVAIIGGMVVSAVGAALLMVMDEGWGVWSVVVAVAVLGLGTGPLFALGTGLVIGSVPPERAGSAASLSETSNFLGGAFGLALLGTVSAAVYSYRMEGAPRVDGLSGSASDHAQETVAGAVHEAAGLSGQAADSLLDTAHAAFVSGLNVAGAISTAIFLLLAVLTMVYFQRSGAGQEGAGKTGARSADAQPAGAEQSG